MGLCRRLAHELLHNAVTSWQAIMPHPHIVTLRSVINSRDFDDLNDLICARTPPLVNSNLRWVYMTRPARVAQLCMTTTRARSRWSLATSPHRYASTQTSIM